MIDAIIIDDELPSIQSLQKDIDRLDLEVQVIKCFQDPHEGLEFIRRNTFDLLFLDLEMPKLHGFQLLEQLDNLSFKVIFVTAYDEYAVRAFEFNAIDYLLKPIQKSKLENAVRKVKASSNRLDGENLNALINNVQLPTQSGIQKIAIPTSYGWDFVHLDDIIYLRADGNYTKIVRHDGTSHLVAKTLKLMSSLLPFDQFFRTHQSYLVNLNHVEKYYRGSGGYLLLSNGDQVAVARTKREELSKVMRL